MMVRWSGERQVNVKSQSELDIGGRQTCSHYLSGKNKNKMLKLSGGWTQDSG